VRRVPRRGADLLLALAWPARRYRCRGCGWEGLQLASAERRPAALRRLAATVGLAVVVAVTLVTLVGEKAPDEAGLLMLGGQAFAAGEHFDGVAVAEGHPLAEASLEPVAQALGGDAADPPAGQAVTAPGTPTRAGLTLRQYCAWGDPGRSPYLGTAAQALRAAGLPDEVVERVAGHIRAGRSIDRVSIRRGEVRGEESGLRFDPRRIALTYGTTMCLDSAVNFAPGHVEYAELFVATDDQGQTHYVMIPDVCGNVSVLRLLEPTVLRSQDPPVVADVPIAPVVAAPMAGAVPGALLLAALPAPGSRGAPPGGTAGSPGSPTLAWLPGGGIGPQAAPRGGRRRVATPPPTGEFPPDQGPPAPDGDPPGPGDPPPPPPAPPDQGPPPPDGDPPGPGDPPPPPAPPDLPLPELEPPEPPFPPPPPPLDPPGLWPGPGPDLLPPPPQEPPQRNYRMSEPGATTLGVVAMIMALAASRGRRRNCSPHR
jgi:hypothetical protein